MQLTVLVCTHNRDDLLGKTLASLNAAVRPLGWRTAAKPGKLDVLNHAIPQIQYPPLPPDLFGGGTAQCIAHHLKQRTRPHPSEVWPHTTSGGHLWNEKN